MNEELREQPTMEPATALNLVDDNSAVSEVLELTKFQLLQKRQKD